MKTQFNKIAIASLLALFLGCTAFADDTAPAVSPSEGPVSQAVRHRFHKRTKAVFEACAKTNGITLPAKGSAQQLSSADRTALRACVQEFRQDVQTCLQNAGVSRPEPGQQPTSADKAAFQQCRSQALSEISASGSSSNGSN